MLNVEVNARDYCSAWAARRAATPYRPHVLHTHSSPRLECGASLRSPPRRRLARIPESTSGGCPTSSFCPAPLTPGHTRAPLTPVRNHLATAPPLRRTPVRTVPGAPYPERPPSPRRPSFPLPELSSGSRRPASAAARGHSGLAGRARPAYLGRVQRAASVPRCRAEPAGLGGAFMPPHPHCAGEARPAPPPPHPAVSHPESG